jgi:hypothetical protein
MHPALAIHLLAGLLVLAASAGTTSPATAQQQSEVAALAARSEVDRLLTNANAQELFENISTPTFGVARHRASGLVCLFTTGHPLNLVVVYSDGPGGPAPGDDVSCRSGIGQTFFTVYATRYPSQPTEEALLDQAMAEVRGVWTDVESLDQPFSYQTSRNYPEPQWTAFTGRLDGHHLRSLTLVQNIGEWSFKGRASGPVDDDDVTMRGSGYYSVALPGNWEERLGQP